MLQNTLKVAEMMTKQSPCLNVVNTQFVLEPNKQPQICMWSSLSIWNSWIICSSMQICDLFMTSRQPLTCTHSTKVLLLLWDFPASATLLEWYCGQVGKAFHCRPKSHVWIPPVASQVKFILCPSSLGRSDFGWKALELNLSTFDFCLCY